MTVMVKYISCLLFVMFGALYNVNAQDYLISTPNTSLLLTAKPGEAARIHYYGTRIEENRIQQIFDSNLAFHSSPSQRLGVFGEDVEAKLSYAGDSRRWKYVIRPGGRICKTVYGG